MQYNTQKQAAPLRPWQDGHDGPERLRHTPSKLHSPLVLEVAAQHPQDLASEAEVRCPRPHHKETDSLEGLRQVQDQGHGPLIFFLCVPISIKTSHTVCWAPPFLPSVASHFSDLTQCVDGVSLSQIKHMHWQTCFLGKSPTVVL